ncbi:unnamed protein product, partial [Mesorhabditis belari]|uniref:Uncharacterized protein n=1 Tax=Mesorhabditis belari TaxID=2138241 RepID=A0AAF3ED02_9BILA
MLKSFENLLEQMKSLELQNTMDFEKVGQSLVCLEEQMHRRLAETKARLCDNEWDTLSTISSTSLSTEPEPSMTSILGALPPKLYGIVELRVAINKARQLLAEIVPELRAAVDCVRIPLVRDDIEAFIKRADNIQIVFNQLGARMENESMDDLDEFVLNAGSEKDNPQTRRSPSEVPVSMPNLNKTTYSS